MYRVSKFYTQAVFIRKTDGIPGVYQIRNTKTGRIYIGESSDMGQRVRIHNGLLSYNAHNNTRLQADYTRYGPSSFRYGVVRVSGQLSERIQIERACMESAESMLLYSRRPGRSVRKLTPQQANGIRLIAAQRPYTYRDLSNIIWSTWRVRMSLRGVSRIIRNITYHDPGYRVPEHRLMSGSHRS